MSHEDYLERDVLRRNLGSRYRIWLVILLILVGVVGVVVLG